MITLSTHGQRRITSFSSRDIAVIYNYGARTAVQCYLAATAAPAMMTATAARCLAAAPCSLLPLMSPPQSESWDCSECSTLSLTDLRRGLTQLEEGNCYSVEFQ